MMNLKRIAKFEEAMTAMFTMIKNGMDADRAAFWATTEHAPNNRLADTWEMKLRKCAADVEMMEAMAEA